MREIENFVGSEFLNKDLGIAVEMGISVGICKCTNIG